MKKLTDKSLRALMKAARHRFPSTKKLSDAFEDTAQDLLVQSILADSSDAKKRLMTMSERARHMAKLAREDGD